MKREQPAKFQRTLASALGIDITGLSRLAAAARLRGAVANALFVDDRPATEKQIKFAASLGIDVTADPMRAAAEKIDAELTVRNIVTLEKLQLQPGDRIKVKGGKDSFVVSSVGKNHKVYFKGGGGQSFWPSQIDRIKKRT